LLAAAPASAQQEPGSIAAVAAATQQSTQWLATLDAHRYAESWADTAEVMRAGRTQDDWVREVGTPREALGKPLMRELKSADYSTEVRGAPTGRYVTVVYLTQYSHAPPVQETILMMMEDEHWHIAGYGVALAPQPAAEPSAGAGSGNSAEPKTKP
jgi:hypothetical protein